MGQARFGKWMPRRKTTCARTPGHGDAGPCRVDGSSYRRNLVFAGETQDYCRQVQLWVAVLTVNEANDDANIKAGVTGRRAAPDRPGPGRIRGGRPGPPGAGRGGGGNADAAPGRRLVYRAGAGVGRAGGCRSRVGRGSEHSRDRRHGRGRQDGVHNLAGELILPSCMPRQ
jgi:hypothetical protein